MNASHRLALDHVWKDFSSSFSASNKSILDEVYAKGLININDYEHHSMTTENDTLLRFIRDSLLSSNKGYDVFLEILRKYFAWIYKKAVAVEEIEMAEVKAYENALFFGEVPVQPRFYIERTEKLENVRDNLIAMERGHKLVLHGMFGIGKSSLAAASIRDKDLLLKTFNNKVYWINIDENTDLLNIMYRLFRKIVMNDRENLKDLIDIVMPSTIDIMKDNLLLLFQKPMYQNSLIILDNVPSEKAVLNFDVGVRLMILSQVILTLNQNYVKYVEVDDSFSVEETIKLFAVCCQTINLNNVSGPEKIHAWCKGDPLMISLVAADVASRIDKFLSSPKEWDKLIDKWNKKKNNTLNEKRHEMIKWCIGRLPGESKERLHDLVIFLPEVNISAKVLEVLWELDTSMVEDIMSKFTQKSLIVHTFSKEQDCYIYEIHPVYLNYLKDTVKADDVMNLHRKLVQAYKGSYSYDKLPNDNYIYQYIGYHLREANMIEEFKIYFDLKFIGAKIKATGIADLLRDYELYRSDITSDDETREEKLEQYVDFVKKYGQNLHIYEHTDIIQSALFLPTDNRVYKDAKKIAVASATRAYFQILAPHDSNYYVHELKLNDNFKAACFSEETNKILVGTESGAIELWEGLYKSKLQVYDNHRHSIISLKVNSNRDMFLSICNYGVLKLWPLTCNKNLNAIDNKGNGYEHQYSPRITQVGHQTRFGFDTTVNKCSTLSLQDEKIKCAAFSLDYSTDFLILTGTDKGRVVVWHKTNEKFAITLLEEQPITSVNFSFDNSLIIVSYQTNIFLYRNQPGNELLKKLTTDFNIKDIHIVHDVYGLIAVQDTCLTYWQWNQEDVPISELVIKDEVSYELFKSHDENSMFQCSAIIENYFVAAISDSRIKMWDIEKKCIVEDFYHPEGPVICLDACLNDKDKSIHILTVLTGFGDRTLKMWYVNPNESDKRKVKKKDLYAVHWVETHKNNLPNPPLLAIVDANNKIQIMRGYKLVGEIDKMNDFKVQALAFSLKGEDVVYFGLVTGAVYKYEIKTKGIKKIMNLESKITYLEVLQMRGSNLGTDELLVVSSNCGKLFVYQREIAKKLRENGKELLKSFFLSSADALITITKNCCSSWCTPTFENNIIYAPPNPSSDDITSACISMDEGLLCLTTNKNFRVMNFFVDHVFNPTLNQSKNLESCIITCSFSANNQYLALGLIDGNINVFNLLNKSLLINLELHKSVVRSVQFSPSGLILTSVAEQMAWWNLAKVPQDSTRRSFRSRSNSTKKRISIDLNHSMTLLNIDWATKEGRTPEMPHLLACIKFHGSYAKKLSFSDDFKSFLTVDDQGELYIMETFNIPNSS